MNVNSYATNKKKREKACIELRIIRYRQRWSQQQNNSTVKRMIERAFQYIVYQRRVICAQCKG